MQSPQFELLIIAIMATLGIYVAGARTNFILAASREQDPKKRTRLSNQIRILMLPVYGIFLIAILATVTLLGWWIISQWWFFLLLLLEFGGLLLIHIANDVRHLMKK